MDPTLTAQAIGYAFAQHQVRMQWLEGRPFLF
jgi:hypothetical protein